MVNQGVFFQVGLSGVLIAAGLDIVVIHAGSLALFPGLPVFVLCLALLLFCFHVLLSTQTKNETPGNKAAGTKV